MNGFITRITSGGAHLAKCFLAVRPANQNSSAGFKVKSMLKLRCRSCYFVRVDGRLHVECNDHPRHKQREIFNVKTLW